MIEYPAKDALAKWSDLILNRGEGQQSRLGMVGLELLDSVCMVYGFDIIIHVT